MNSDLIGLAFTAGMVAAFNPCGFAMLPAYLALVVSPDEHSRLGAIGRALAATAAMALGFLAVFGTFGLLTVSLASTVQRYLPFVTVGVGTALVALGLWLLLGRELPAWSTGRGPGWAATPKVGSMVGYGVSYAIASLSCTIGPFLAVTGSSLRSGSVLAGVLVYAAYAAGIALVVGALAVAVALGSSALLARMRRVLPFVNRISGFIMVAVGLYVAYYGWFELRLFAGGSPDDPVITAAGRLQRAVAGWVYQNGAWPWVVVLGTLIVIGAVGGRVSRRRHPARSGPSPLDSPP